MCCHENDFKMKIVSYNFFATSHGKTNCDGIGAVVKRKAMLFCLRSEPEYQITNAQEMYCYLSKELIGVR